MSIPDAWSKIKGSVSGSQVDRMSLIYGAIIVISSIASFGLGRLSTNTEARTDSGITITEATDLTASAASPLEKVEKPKPTIQQKFPVTNAAIQTTGNYVASKHGKLYYPNGCKSANRIKPENQVWFDSAHDAELSGYTASAHCK